MSDVPLVKMLLWALVGGCIGGITYLVVAIAYTLIKAHDYCADKAGLPHKKIGE